ncbi:hypothetical protein EPN29_09320 [bacterium]|nr:MAG: hypothetical protein EPN29_09320 [bacterium]
MPEQPETHDLTTGVELDPITRDVMAWAGVAMAWGQALEAELSAYAWLSHPKTSTLTRRDYLRLLASIQRQTLGSLVRELKPRIPQQGAMFKQLTKVIERRNFVIHHFFRTPQRQAMMKTDDGRAAMVAELQTDAVNFRRWTEAIKPVVLMYAVEKGLRVRDLLDRAPRLRAQPAIEGKSMTAQAQVAVTMDPHHAEYLVDVLKKAQRSAERRR